MLSLSLSQSLSHSLTRPRPLFFTSFTPRRHSHSLSFSTTPIKMSSETIEHIVLFKVKPNTAQAQITTMLTNLHSLKSLDVVLHLTAGPLLRNRSSSPLTFTHLLHSRYKSKPDLAHYTAHPAHMSVVKSDVLPICEDIMAVDWVSHDLPGPAGLSPGSAMRVQFVKLKEGLGENEKCQVLDVIAGMKGSIDSIQQLSYGENFSPARAKGFEIASLGVFNGVKELEGLDEKNDVIEKEKEKVRGFIDELVVVDYVVPSAQSSSASL